MENKKDCLCHATNYTTERIRWQLIYVLFSLPTLLLPSIKGIFSHSSFCTHTHTHMHTILHIIIVTDHTRIGQKSKAEMTDSTNSTRD